MFLFVGSEIARRITKEKMCEKEKATQDCLGNGNAVKNGYQSTQMWSLSMKENLAKWCTILHEEIGASPRWKKSFHLSNMISV